MLEDASNELARSPAWRCSGRTRSGASSTTHLAWCDERIAAHAQGRRSRSQHGGTLIGIGPVTASAVVATVGDFKQFKNGAQFGAWLGLTPRQNSSGGKTSLGGITKRGDNYLRTLLIQGAKSAVMTAHQTRRTASPHGLLRCASARAGRRPSWRWPTRTPASCGR